MKMKMLVTLTAVFLLVACGGSRNLEETPTILYGEDVCEECSMIISETRYAAAYVLVDGTVRRFDDMGDMLAYDSKHQEDVHVYWVHDYNSEDWIMAKHAFFVLNNEAQTPMGWGLLAFSADTAAKHYMAVNGGTATAWLDLQTAVAAGELDPGTLNAHIDSHETINHEEMEHEHSNYDDMEHNEHHDSDR